MKNMKLLSLTGLERVRDKIKNYVDTTFLKEVTIQGRRLTPSDNYDDRVFMGIRMYVTLHQLEKYTYNTRMSEYFYGSNLPYNASDVIDVFRVVGFPKSPNGSPNNPAITDDFINVGTKIYVELSDNGTITQSTSDRKPEYVTRADTYVNYLYRHPRTNRVALRQTTNVESPTSSIGYHVRTNSHLSGTLNKVFLHIPGAGRCDSLYPLSIGGKFNISKDIRYGEVLELLFMGDRWEIMNVPLDSNPYTVVFKGRAFVKENLTPFDEFLHIMVSNMTTTADFKDAKGNVALEIPKGGSSSSITMDEAFSVVVPWDDFHPIGVYEYALAGLNAMLQRYPDVDGVWSGNKNFGYLKEDVYMVYGEILRSARDHYLSSLASTYKFRNIHYGTGTKIHFNVHFKIDYSMVPNHKVASLAKPISKEILKANLQRCYEENLFLGIDLLMIGSSGYCSIEGLPVAYKELESGHVLLVIPSFNRYNNTTPNGTKWMYPISQQYAGDNLICRSDMDYLRKFGLRFSIYLLGGFTTSSDYVLVIREVSYLVS